MITSRLLIFCAGAAAHALYPRVKGSIGPVAAAVKAGAESARRDAAKAAADAVSRRGPSRS